MGAMYLAGYAVECALKGFLIRKYGTGTHGVVAPPGLPVTLDLIVPVLEALPSLGFNWRRHSHDLNMLWAAAYFAAPDVTMLAHLGTCGGWQVEWRYTPPHGKTRQEAEEFVQAARELTGWISAQVS